MFFHDIFIDAEQFVYTVAARTLKIEDTEFVVTSDLRAKEFEQKVDEIGLLFGGIQLRYPYDLKNDIDDFIKILNMYNRPIDLTILEYSFIGLCREHIKLHGRLFYIDLLMYIDMYILVVKAIYNFQVTTYKTLYKKTVHLILNTFPADILFQGPFGELYSWNDVDESE